MTRISLRRLGLFFRYDFMTTWRGLATIGGAMTLIFFLIQIFSFRGLIAGTMLYEDIPIEDIRGYLLDDYAGVCLIISFIFFLFIGARLQAGYLNKQTRLQLLILPATMQEKFIVRFVHITVYTVVLALLAFFAADVLRLIFEPLFGPNRMGFVARDALIVIFSDFKWEKTIDVLPVLLHLHAFYVLGGAFFRKYPVVLTALTHFTLGAVFAIIAAIVLTHWEGDSVFGLGWQTDEQREAWVYIFRAFSILLTLGEYYLAYVLFTRQQVLGRSLINI